MSPPLRLFFRASLFAAVSALIPCGANAQSPDPILGQAKALFDQASTDLDAGNYASACLKLEKVARLLPDAIGAKETLGECFEKQGKLASAWSQYGAAAELATTQGKAERAKKNKKLADGLEAHVAFLTISVPAKVRAAPGLTLSQDGERVVEARWDKPWPVDTGSHEIAANASGYEPFKATVKIEADGARARITIDLVVQKPPPVIPPPPPPHPRPWQSPLGFATIAAGAAGIGIGLALGYNAMILRDKSNAIGHCAANECDVFGYQKRSQAREFGDGATGAVIAGSVLAALGAVVIWTAPRAPSKPSANAPGVALSFGGTGLSLSGDW